MASWRLEDVVQADRRGRQWRTADRWPDTWRRDMTMPPSKLSQVPSQATPTQVSPTPTPAQVIDGPITRSRAKKLQQEVHALLCEIHFNINGNYIIPKCCTLIVLTYIEEEKDESDPEERTSASSRRSQKRTSESQKRTSAKKSS